MFSRCFRGVCPCVLVHLSSKHLVQRTGASTMHLLLPSLLSSYLEDFANTTGQAFKKTERLRTSDSISLICYARTISSLFGSWLFALKKCRGLPSPPWSTFWRLSERRFDMLIDFPFVKVLSASVVRRSSRLCLACCAFQGCDVEVNCCRPVQKRGAKF